MGDSVLTRDRSDADEDDDGDDEQSNSTTNILLCYFIAAVRAHAWRPAGDGDAAPLPLPAKKGVRFADDAPVFSDDRSAASSTFR